MSMTVPTPLKRREGWESDLPARPEALVGRAEHAISAVGDKMAAFMRHVAPKV